MIVTDGSAVRRARGRASMSSPVPGDGAFKKMLLCLRLMFGRNN